MRMQTISKQTITIILTGMLGVLSNVQADTADASMRWQLNVLNNPSASQLRREQNGSIMIYDRLTDKTVESTMDNQFDRLDSMMFTSVIVTDASGDFVINPNTGEVEVEDDGCD